jgi:hypothetical protein
MQADPELDPDLTTLLGKLMLNANKDDLRELYEFIVKYKESSKSLSFLIVIADFRDITDDESRLVNQFINRFTIA